jgi:hypothetical protein
MFCAPEFVIVREIVEKPKQLLAGMVLLKKASALSTPSVLAW